jgi:flagella basal body P-ring formation protein FlgA
MAVRFGSRVKLIALCVLSFLSAASARAGDSEDIALPVPTVTIYPGDVIEDDKIADRLFIARTVTRGSVIEARNAVIGKVARRTLLPGHLILRNAITEPAVVEKGSIVAAIYQDGELTITASVLALQSGALSQAIQVRNVDSGKVIVGAVQADGSVRIAAQ